ncbi:phosphatidylserine decarboxylase [Desulfobacterium sp. N47]|uniref:Phosphatidylserine decarboxylase proenzyme n=1 Tax=uncultured Desulfobacterium sp. TaxID=201089 RepID=E1YFK0_9BACT|nr:Phosphatidylserine decarboxylase proenzyme [uncultured Desulfobacterium sp.]
MDDKKKVDTDNNSAFPIAAPGYYFIIATFFATVVFALAGVVSLATICFTLTLFVCWFFRNPERVTPMVDGAVVSPADGKVIIIEPLSESPFSKGACIKISIFMSVFNVHVNRIPHEGKVINISYFPGKFFNASFDKASKENEHNAILIETEKGKKICAVQIAGLIARRIICRLKHGDIVKRGERFGMICFGSRLDVYLPADSKICVAVGNKIKAGSGILGYLA